MRIPYSFRPAAAPGPSGSPQRLLARFAELAGLTKGAAPGTDEAFLALSTDHADCERRQRWLDQRHRLAWRDTWLP